MWLWLLFRILQKGEVKGELEVEGAKRALLQLERRGVKVTDLATDRHKALAAWLRTNRPSIEHHNDLWHLVRNYRNKLAMLSGARTWCKSIEAHILWYGNWWRYCITS